MGAPDQPRDDHGRWEGNGGSPAHAAGHADSVPRVTYTGTVKVGRSYVDTGGHATREAARDAARALNPNAKSVSTGYGYAGTFDMRSHSKYD